MRFLFLCKVFLQSGKNWEGIIFLSEVADHTAVRPENTLIIMLDPHGAMLNQL